MAIEFISGSNDLAIDSNGTLFNGSLVKLPYFKDRDGYLKFRHNGIEKFVHEEVYKHFIGPIGDNQLVDFKDGDLSNVTAENLIIVTVTQLSLSRSDTYYDYFRTKYLQKNPHVEKQILQASKPEPVVDEPKEIPKASVTILDPDIEPDGNVAEEIDKAIEAMKDDDDKDQVEADDRGYCMHTVPSGADLEDDLALKTLARIINENELVPSAAVKYLNERGVKKNGKKFHNTHLRQCREHGYIE